MANAEHNSGLQPSPPPHPWLQHHPPSFCTETTLPRHKSFSYPLILTRHWSYFIETFHQWPCGTNSPEPAARESRSATSAAHQFKEGRWSAILGSGGKGKTVFKSGTTKYRLSPCKRTTFTDQTLAKSTLFLLALLLFSLATQPHQLVTHCSTEQKYPGHSKTPVSQWDTPCVRAPSMLVGAAEVQPAQNHILPCSKPHSPATAPAPAASNQLSKPPPTLQRKLQVFYCF